jgi:thioredoxin 1
MAIITLKGEEDLGKAVQKNDTLLIDFWAPWCGPCRGFVPILEKTSEAHTDIAFCRVNTEECPGLATSFDVEHIPTLVAIKERVIVASEVGTIPAEKLEELIAKVKALDMNEVRRELAERRDPVRSAG